jgi:glyoxylase I family protein
MNGSHRHYTARHVAIVVHDLRTMVEFYTNVLGWLVVKEYEIDGEDFSRGIGVDRAAAKGVHLVVPGCQLMVELLQFAGANPANGGESRADGHGFRHVAFWVDDIDALVEEISAKGGRFVTPQAVLVTKPPTVAGIRFIYMKDPEGNIIEFNRTERRIGV